MILRLVKFTISLFIAVYDFTVNFTCSILNIDRLGTCTILYYHNVNKFHYKQFCRQMDVIERFAKVIPSDYAGYLQNNVHYVAITFDDAFSNILDTACPVMFKKKFAFTIFVPTGHLGKKAKWIKSHKDETIDLTIMSKKQIQELNCYNEVLIGSHGVNHVRIAELSDENALHEIIQSKKTLEKILSQSISTFSFPHGSYKRKHLEYARQAGYSRVFTINPGNALIEHNEFVSSRVKVDPDDWSLEFRLKSLGAYRWLPIAYSLKREISKKLTLEF